MRYLRLTLLALAVVACGDSGVDPNAADFYTLTSVNGRALPYVLAEVGGDRLVIDRGDVSVSPNGEFYRSLKLRLSTPEDAYFVITYGITTAVSDYLLLDSGTWVREGQNLRLLGKDAVTGVIDDGDLLTIQQTVQGVGSEQLAPADYALSLGFRRPSSR